MTLEKTIALSRFMYPELKPSREDVLHHLFLVLGNGYEWQDGELVDCSRPRWQQDRYDAALARVESGEVPTWERTEFSGSIYCNGEYLTALPDDVKPDWRAGWEEAVALCRRLGIEPQVWVAPWETQTPGAGGTAR